MINFRIMIGATPRSGTTIFQQVLAAHPQVTSPPETHFFIEITDEKELLAPDVKPETIHRRFQKHSHLDIFANMLTENEFREIQQASDSRETFFRRLMDQLAEKENASGWVEKTPHHLRLFPLLMDEISSLKTVVIVRDPRDVCSSMRNIRFTTDNLQQLATRWLSENIFARECQKKYEDRVKIIPYKKLVYKTEQTVRELCQYAKINFHEDQLHPEKTAEAVILLEGEEMKERNFRPITDESIGRYREDLTQEEIQLVEAVTAPVANSLLDKDFELSPQIKRQADEISRQFQTKLQKK